MHSNYSQLEWPVFLVLQTALEPFLILTPRVKTKKSISFLKDRDSIVHLHFANGSFEKSFHVHCTCTQDDVCARA